MTLSRDQHRIRRGCITASDVPAILGMHPYRRPIDVWACHVHGIMGVDTADTRWGQAIEPAVREWFAAETGMTVTVPGTLLAADDRRHGATPDGLCSLAGRVVKGLEIKAHDQWEREWYGAPGTDDVPEHEVLQCAWGCRVVGIESWALAVTFGHAPLVYEIARDMELERMVREEVDAWWDAHVVTGTPPGPDGSESYDRWMRARREPRPVDVEVEYETVRDEVEELRAALAAARQHVTEADAARQRLQRAMGEGTRIITPDGAITWRCDKNNTPVFRTPRKWSRE